MLRTWRRTATDTTGSTEVLESLEDALLRRLGDGPGIPVFLVDPFFDDDFRGALEV